MSFFSGELCKLLRTIVVFLRSLASIIRKNSYFRNDAFMWISNTSAHGLNKAVGRSVGERYRTR